MTGPGKVAKVPERFTFAQLADEHEPGNVTRWRLDLNGHPIAEGPIETLPAVARLVFAAGQLSRFMNSEQLAAAWHAPTNPLLAMFGLAPPAPQQPDAKVLHPPPATAAGD